MRSPNRLAVKPHEYHCAVSRFMAVQVCVVRRRMAVLGIDYPRAFAFVTVAVCRTLKLREFAVRRYMVHRWTTVRLSDSHSPTHGTTIEPHDLRQIGGLRVAVRDTGFSPSAHSRCALRRIAWPEHRDLRRNPSKRTPCHSRATSKSAHLRPGALAALRTLASLQCIHTRCCEICRRAARDRSKFAALSGPHSKDTSTPSPATPTLPLLRPGTPIEKHS